MPCAHPNACIAQCLCFLSSHAFPRDRAMFQSAFAVIRDGVSTIASRSAHCSHRSQWQQQQQRRSAPAACGLTPPRCTGAAPRPGWWRRCCARRPTRTWRRCSPRRGACGGTSAAWASGWRRSRRTPRLGSASRRRARAGPCSPASARTSRARRRRAATSRWPRSCCAGTSSTRRSLASSSSSARGAAARPTSLRCSSSATSAWRTRSCWRPPRSR